VNILYQCCLVYLSNAYTAIFLVYLLLTLLIVPYHNQRNGDKPFYNCPLIQHYGGKGVIVWDAWLHDFAAFRDWAFSNGYIEGLSIDRINNNGNYEPSNCRWLTRSEHTTKDNLARSERRFKISSF